jgi:hypothetical protein
VPTSSRSSPMRWRRPPFKSIAQEDLSDDGDLSQERTSGGGHS